MKFIRPRISRTAEPNLSVLPDGDRLLDNYDLCKRLNISKCTLQRYRTSGDLPYRMIYHKTFYRESDVLRFIERNFSKFRKMKKEGRIIHLEKENKIGHKFVILPNIDNFAKKGDEL